jgi:hypothetical protein
MLTVASLPDLRVGGKLLREEALPEPIPRLHRRQCLTSSSIVSRWLGFLPLAGVRSRAPDGLAAIRNGPAQGLSGLISVHRLGIRAANGMRQ